MSSWTDESFTNGFEFDFENTSPAPKEFETNKTDPDQNTPFCVNSVKFEEEAAPKLLPIRCPVKTAYLYKWDIKVGDNKLGSNECAVIWDKYLDQITPSCLEISVGMIHAYDGVHRFVPAKNWDPRSLPSLQTLRYNENPQGDFPLGNVGGLHCILANPIPGFLLYDDSLNYNPYLCTRKILTGNQMAKAVSSGNCHFDWVAPRLLVVCEGGDLKDIVSGKGMKILLDLPCPMSIYSFSETMENENISEIATVGDLWGSFREIMKRYSGAYLALGGVPDYDWYALNTSDDFKFGRENAFALNQIRWAAQH
jgi:hypothetical protein